MSEGASEGFDVLCDPPVAWAEIDEHHLIFALVNQFRQGFDEQDSLRGREVAAKDGILLGVGVAAHGAMHLAQGFGVGDVVADDVAVTHLQTHLVQNGG